MAGTVAILLESKTVIGLNKNSKNSLEILQLPRKTSAPPGQCWDIMAQISVDTFHREGVILIMDVVNMSSWVDYIQIPLVSICAVIFCLRRGVNHPLNRPGQFIPAYHMSHDLPRFSAHHGHNVDIFPGFCPGFVLQKPVQLIQFHNFCACCGYCFTLRLNGLFLSNSSHWICLFPVSFPLHGR